MKAVINGDTHGEKSLLSGGVSKVRDLIAKKHLDAKLIHVGDYGYGNDWFYGETTLSDILRVVPGNHEDYDYLETNHLEINLGDFGVLPLPTDKKVFFVRGAYSIDKLERIHYYTRTGIRSWWWQEELTVEQMDKCYEEYIAFKPDIVISHECPDLVNYRLVNDPNFIADTRTGRLLSKMYFVHQPENWYFGHYHKSYGWEENGTNFKCLGIGESIIVDL